jgi:succinoglycan biosynthesis protein ExoO
MDCEFSITTIVPVYNAVATLAAAIASLQAQSWTAQEIIIVDDASSDGSGALARRLASEDARIRVISLPRNRGKANAMNHAIAQSRGVWVAVLDADDRFHPRRLETLVRAAEAEGVEMVADNQVLFDQGAGIAVRTAFDPAAPAAMLRMAEFLDRVDAMAEFDVGLLKPIVRREFIQRSGLRYCEDARLSEDFFYLLDFFAAGGSGLLVPMAMYRWTQPFGSISRRWTSTGGGAWRYGYAGAVELHRRYEGMLRRAGHAQAVRVLARRRRAFVTLHHASLVRRLHTEHRDFLRAATTFVLHPRVTAYLLRQLGRKALVRLRHFGPAPRLDPRGLEWCVPGE